MHTLTLNAYFSCSEVSIILIGQSRALLPRFLPVAAGFILRNRSFEAKMATKMDGTAIAGTIRQELKQVVDDMIATHGVSPGLAVVLVGNRTDSATYVRMKKKACAEIGIRSIGIDLPAEVTQEELVGKVDELNKDPSINGILVQLPLPPHIDEQTVLDRISQEKDVDGLHP